MTPSRLREEASRCIVEAQLLLETDPETAADHLRHAYCIASCLAHPPKEQAPSDAWLLRLLEGKEPRRGEG